MVSFTLKKLRQPPAPFQKRHREQDLLWYGPAEVLVGVFQEKVVGGIRFCREVGKRHHGLLTDFFYERQYRKTLPRALIHAGQAALREKGVKVFSGLVIDGQGLVGPFYAMGYKPIRRTVLLRWDLSQLGRIETNSRIRVRMFEKPTAAIARFIAQSYQPYWVWWRGKSLMREFRRQGTQRFFCAYQDGKLIGVTDANVREQSCARHCYLPATLSLARQAGAQALRAGDTFDWGPMIHRRVKGQRLGSSLLVPALTWLQGQGLRYAQFTATSGLDDYDPAVYLCTLSTGAKIEKEYIVLGKVDGPQSI